MSSFTSTTSDSQNRTQRRLVFEGFNIQDTATSHRRHTGTMLTSTPDHKLHDKDNEHLELIPSSESHLSEPCLLQLQNARQLLHSMSRTNAPAISEQPVVDEQQVRPVELFTDTNPELAYYKSSLESERNRRKQLETLVDVQQQRLTEAESELIQLRANDHKKTLCMKQLEQMIPNVVDEWKQKETEYKTKVNNLTQQIKQIEQTNREKILHEKQQYDAQLNEKAVSIERLTKDSESMKKEYESLQTKTKQNEQRIQQLTKDSEQAKQRWSTLENDLRNEIKNGETRFRDMQSELDRKQEQIEQMMRDQQKANSDYQAKIRQIENELDEQRRENNVLKMELELREAKYRAQMESLKIQLMREAETKLTQRLEEQHAKHMQIEEELNELNRRKLSDLEEKHAQILSIERSENENRVQILLNKLDQMKHEIEHIQTTTNAERQDLAKKLQDVFETTLLKGTGKPNFLQNEVNISSAITSIQNNPVKMQLADVQTKVKGIEYLPTLSTKTNDHPTDLSTIRTLSSRIDSLVDQTNRVASGFEFSSHFSLPIQQANNLEKIEDDQSNFLPSRPHSSLQSPYFRSTPIDPLQDWYPPATTQPSSRSNNMNNNNSHSQSTHRSHSADPSNNSGLFSIFPYQGRDLQQQQQTLNSFSLDSNLNINHAYQPSYRLAPSITSSLVEHQQEIPIAKLNDNHEILPSEQASSANESLTRYVKMLLERSPTQDKNSINKHPLAKTNQSLHDLQLSIEQLNLAEREHKAIIDDLTLHSDSHTSHIITPQPQKPSTVHSSRAKKRLDYDVHNNKQSNTNELFERLSQPKTRVKKDKAKQQQQQQQPNSTTGAHSAWK